MKHYANASIYLLTRELFIAVYAFGETFIVLFAARAVQGIGSSLISVSGVRTLSSYDDDDDDVNNKHYT